MCKKNRIKVDLCLLIILLLKRDHKTRFFLLINCCKSILLADTAFFLFKLEFIPRNRIKYILHDSCIDVRVVSKNFIIKLKCIFLGGQLKTKNGQKYVVNQYRSPEGYFISKPCGFLYILLLIIMMILTAIITYLLLSQRFIQNHSNT